MYVCMYVHILLDATEPSWYCYRHAVLCFHQWLQVSVVSLSHLSFSLIFPLSVSPAVGPEVQQSVDKVPKLTWLHPFMYLLPASSSFSFSYVSISSSLREQSTLLPGLLTNQNMSRFLLILRLWLVSLRDVCVFAHVCVYVCMCVCVCVCMHTWAWVHMYS